MDLKEIQNDLSLGYEVEAIEKLDKLIEELQQLDLSKWLTKRNLSYTHIQVLEQFIKEEILGENQDSVKETLGSMHATHAYATRKKGENQ